MQQLFQPGVTGKVPGSNNRTEFPADHRQTLHRPRCEDTMDTAERSFNPWAQTTPHYTADSYFSIFLSPGRKKQSCRKHFTPSCFFVSYSRSKNLKVPFYSHLQIFIFTSGLQWSNLAYLIIKRNSIDLWKAAHLAL